MAKNEQTNLTMEKEYKSVIEKCLACVDACEDGINYCMKSGLAKPELINILRDCMEVCQTTASLMIRGSEHGLHLAKECHEVCDECADECNNSHIEYLQKCAEICKTCASESIKFLIC